MVEKRPVQGDSRGLLKRTTPSDRGLIESPLLTPHLGFHVIGDEQVLLVSEDFNTLLRGRIHCDLMPLLDGDRTVQEIVAALAPAHSPLDVQTAILALASRGYVVSGDHDMAPGRAAYWSSLGASPRWAEQRLAATAVRVAGDTGVLARRLVGLGVQTSDEAVAVRPSLSVMVCADYLDERHDSINRRHLESRTPWVLVRPNGMQPLLGPVFRPAEGGACWACLAYRLRGHQEVHAFLRNLGPDASTVEPRAAEPAVLRAVCGLAAAEIAKWLVLEDMAPIHERAISLDVAAHRSAQHPAMRRPQCVACGDEALHRADRAAEPVRLAGESQDLSQQRRPPLGPSRGDAGQVSSSRQSGHRRRDVAGPHRKGHRPLASCVLGGEQSRAGKPQAGFTASEPAEQERREGQLAAAVGGERALRGGRALQRRLSWRRDPLPEASCGFREGRRIGGNSPE